MHPEAFLLWCSVIAVGNNSRLGGQVTVVGNLAFSQYSQDKYIGIGAALTLRGDSYKVS